jgi:hypothetical protein
MTPLRPRWFLLASLALLTRLFPAPGHACPFCQGQGRLTLMGEYAKAKLVLFGKFSNAKLSPDGDFQGGTTDFTIDTVLQDKAKVLGKKKTITLNGYLPRYKTRFLLFCDVYKGKIDPVRLAEVEGEADIVKYLKGAMALKDKPKAARLRYAFKFLDSPELEIGQDAYQEFANADYNDYKDMARKLPADKIAGWLEDKDSKTPTYRLGLYASLLGHCGIAKHAKLLRKLLDDPQKWPQIGLEGMLAGYTILSPKEGWAYLRGILNDPKKEFQLRYAALKAVRFFWDTRPDLVKKKDLVAGLCLLLKHTDLADFVIEDLRKWKVWEAADKVMALAASKPHDAAVIKRALLRYALSWPKRDARAKAFIESERKKDKETVEEIEELLKAEKEAASK